MWMWLFQGRVGFKNSKKKTPVCGQTVGFAIGLVSGQSVLMLHMQVSVAVLMLHMQVSVAVLMLHMQVSVAVLMLHMRVSVYMYVHVFAQMAYDILLVLVFNYK